MLANAFKLLIFLLLSQQAFASTERTGAPRMPPRCEALLRKTEGELKAPLASFSELDFEIPAHREAVIKAVDASPDTWYALKQYYPETAARLEPHLYVPLNEVGPLAGMAPAMIDLVLKNTEALQLENICRVGCPWCAFSHNQKAKYQQMPVNVVRTIIKRVGDLNLEGNRNHFYTQHSPNLQMLYYESDPFNYDMPLEPGSSVRYYYPELHKMVIGYTGRHIYVSTAVPKGREEKVLEFIDKKLYRGSQLRISVSDHNRERLQTVPVEDGLSFEAAVQKRIQEWKKWIGDWVSENIQVFSRLSDDNLYDSLMQANRVLGQRGIQRFFRVDPRSDNNTLLLGSRDIEMVTNLRELSKEKLQELFTLVPNQRRLLVRNLAMLSALEHSDFFHTQGPIFLYNVEPARIGRAFDDETKRHVPNYSIGCFNGVLITPNKVYNVVQLLEPTQKYKDGQVLVELSKELPRQPPPLLAPIEEVLRYGVVKAVGVNELLSSQESRTSFWLLDFQGNPHRYHLQQDGDQLMAKLAFTLSLESTTRPSP